MECHDGLMARRRKKTKNAAARAKQSSNPTILLDKSLPALPPNPITPMPGSTFPVETDAPTPEPVVEMPAEVSKRPAMGSRSASLGLSTPDLKSTASSKRMSMQIPATDGETENLTLPASTYKPNRNSHQSQDSQASEEGNDFFIPMGLDPSILPTPPEDPVKASQKENGPPQEYSPPRGSQPTSRKASQEPQTRSASVDQDSSQPGSPHIAYQEKGREHTNEVVETLRKRHLSGSASATSGKSRDASPMAAHNEREKFQLQDVPKRQKSGPTIDDRDKRTSADRPTLAESKYRSSSQTIHAPLREQQPNVSAHQLSSTEELGSIMSSQPPKAMPPTRVPKRGDSLVRSTGSSKMIPRKDVGNNRPVFSPPPQSEPRQDLVTSPMSVDTPSSTYSSNIANGGLVIGKPMESPISKSHLDFPQRSKDRPVYQSGDSFASPRVPPDVPTERARHKGKSASVSTITDQQPSSPLPRYKQDGDFSMTEDMARIMGDNIAPEGSFLKRVSNSVRHARSHSDRGVRNSREHKWQKSTLNGSTTSGSINEYGTPVMSTPESAKEVEWYKIELRRERQRLTEKEERILDLEGVINGKTAIKQMNTELREKRSTMVVLDTQKEIVVRELEVLTEHIAANKKTSGPMDLDKLSNVVLREFAESLQKLKDQFAPQIEELMEHKSDLLEEIARLNQNKERAFQEFEQLSVKNAQLAEFNNDLVSSMNRQLDQHGGGSRGPPPPGLGLYAQHMKELTPSLDGSARPSTIDSHMTGSTVVQDPHDDSTIMAAPKIVDVRKGPQKRFVWKKGGAVAKSVGRGLKGAFTSNEDSHNDSMHTTEGIPYGQTIQTGEYPSTTLPRAASYAQGQQSFGPRQKMPLGKSGLNGGTVPEDPSGRCGVTVGFNKYLYTAVLFGSELEARTKYEHAAIPGIVTRCIQEVETRGKQGHNMLKSVPHSHTTGMDVEGIYRKSGGNSQIQMVKDGFEHSNDFDVSDPDLDINAVTSCLKQYFRRLPVPLITFTVYDKLLASTTTPNPEDRIVQMRHALVELPRAHKDCLEFLIFHLARVVKEERMNLMTDLNCAVVFAPTIMRPESIAREMTDTTAKNAAVQFMIVNCVQIFMRERNGSIA